MGWQMWFVGLLLCRHLLLSVLIPVYWIIYYDVVDSYVL